MSAGTDQESDNDERRRLGDRLREVREYLGFTRREVAAYLRIPQAAVTNIEDGQQCVEATELIGLARLYQVPVAHFSREDRPPAGLPVEIAHLAQNVTDLSPQDSDELSRFAEYLHAHSCAPRG